MQKVASAKKSHPKLKIILGLIALLVAGYFVYKYSYIHIERRKYDQATVAINKVADDLRSQGINTEFSKGCGRDQAKFNTGSLSCAVSITYQGSALTHDTREVLEKFTLAILKQGFKKSSGNLSYMKTPIDTGESEYQTPAISLICSLFYTTIDGATEGVDQIGYSCGELSKFRLF